MSETQIPVNIDPTLVQFLFIDMIHDFSPNNLTGNIASDLVLFKSMFEVVFGADVVNPLLTDVSQQLAQAGRTLNIDNWIHAAHEWAYGMCRENGKFFFNDPTTRNGKTTISLCNTLESLKEGGIITQSDADWRTLHAGKFYQDSFDEDGNAINPTQVPAVKDPVSGEVIVEAHAAGEKIAKPVLLIEDSSKGLRRIPLLFSETFNTISRLGDNPKLVINLETIAGLYDEAESALATANELAYMNQNVPGLSPNKDCVNLFKDQPINFQLGTGANRFFDIHLKTKVDSSTDSLNVINVGCKLLSGLYNFINEGTKRVYLKMKEASFIQYENPGATPGNNKDIQNIIAQLLSVYDEKDITKFLQITGKYTTGDEKKNLPKQFGTYNKFDLNLFMFIQAYHLHLVLDMFCSRDSLVNQWVIKYYSTAGSGQALLTLVQSMNSFTQKLSVLAGAEGFPVQATDAQIAVQKDKTTVADVFTNFKEYYYGNPSKAAMGEKGTAKFNNGNKIAPLLFNKIMMEINSLFGDSSKELSEEEKVGTFNENLKKQKDLITQLINRKFQIFASFFGKAPEQGGLGEFEIDEETGFGNTSGILRDKSKRIKASIDCGKTACPKYQSLLTGTKKGVESPETYLGENFISRLDKTKYEFITQEKSLFFGLIAHFCFVDSPLSLLRSSDSSNELFIQNYFSGWFSVNSDKTISLSSDVNSMFLVSKSLQGILETMEQDDAKLQGSVVVTMPDDINSVITGPTQHPSVKLISLEFREELFKQLQQHIVDPGDKLNAKRALTQESGRTDKISDLTQQYVNRFITILSGLPDLAKKQEIVRKLFCILFKKTFSDFSQIILARTISEQFPCSTNTYSNVVWLISQDIMMTFIALYWGSNILQIRTDEKELMSKGTVNYGFGNSAAYNPILQREIAQNKSLDFKDSDVFDAINDSFHLSDFRLDLAEYNSGKTVAPSVPIATSGGGGKKKFRKSKKRARKSKQTRKKNDVRRIKMKIGKKFNNRKSFKVKKLRRRTRK